MKWLLIIVLLAPSVVSCTKKTSLTSDEEQFVEITLALMRTRANVASSGGDSVQLRRSLDSIYKAYDIDSAQYVEMSAELAERPGHALLAYQTIRDSLGLK